MIKAIEIKTIEKCPYYKSTYCQDGNNFCSHDSMLCCVGLDSPDCPLNVIRCETCRYDYHSCPQWGWLAYKGFCSAYEPKETK